MSRPTLKEQDFIHPYGQLDPKQFAQVTDCLEDDIQKWLWLANTQTQSIVHEESRRCAIEDFVYWKAYFALWQFLNSQPIETSVEEKTIRYIGGQIQSVRTLWESYQEKYMTALAAINTGTYTDEFRSRVVSSVPVWDPVRTEYAGTEADQRAQR